MFGITRRSVERAKLEIELADEIITLKKEKAELEIRIEVQKAAYERGALEIRHMIGLEKKRQEMEIANAKREATVTVREENLIAKKEQFEASMKFREEQFKSEMTRMQGFLEEITKRLPVVNVNKSVRG